MNTQANRFEKAFSQECRNQLRETSEDFDATSDEDITTYTAAKETYAVLVSSNLGQSPEEIARIAWQCARSTARALRTVTFQ